MTNKEFIYIFIKRFGKDIDSEFLSENVYHFGFAWHIFSFKKIDKSKYSEGKEAIEKYLQKDKNNAIALKRFPDELITDMNKFDTIQKLSEYSEIYVFDKDFKWCFIKTHECDLDEIDDFYLGPYYIEEK